MNSTYATVIVPLEALSLAQADFPEVFTTGLSTSGTLPATHYISSGYFLTSDLERLLNSTTWPRQVFFGDVHQTLTTLNLQVANPAVE